MVPEEKFLLVTASFKTHIQATYFEPKKFNKTLNLLKVISSKSRGIDTFSPQKIQNSSVLSNKITLAQYITAENVTRILILATTIMQGGILVPRPFLIL